MITDLTVAVHIPVDPASDSLLIKNIRIMVHDIFGLTFGRNVPDFFGKSSELPDPVLWEFIVQILK